MEELGEGSEAGPLAESSHSWAMLRKRSHGSREKRVLSKSAARKNLARIIEGCVLGPRINYTESLRDMYYDHG